MPLIASSGPHPRPLNTRFTAVISCPIDRRSGPSTESGIMSLWNVIYTTAKGGATGRGEKFLHVIAST